MKRPTIERERSNMMTRKIFLAFTVAATFATFPALAQLGSPIPIECKGKEKSHFETRACLQTTVDASDRKLMQAEGKIRGALESWDQERALIKHSLSMFDASIKQFRRFRQQQCEFIASLAAGGNSQGDLRLSCIQELNEKRIAHLLAIQIFLHPDAAN